MMNTKNTNMNNNGNPFEHSFFGVTAKQLLKNKTSKLAALGQS